MDNAKALAALLIAAGIVMLILTFGDIFNEWRKKK